MGYVVAAPHLKYVVYATTQIEDGNIGSSGMLGLL